MWIKTALRVTLRKIIHTLKVSRQREIVADDASWATNIENVKESMKSNAPSELKRKSLLVNEDKTEDYFIRK